MKTIKEQLDDHRQNFYDDLTAAIVRFEGNTGAKIKQIYYKESAYCKFLSPTLVNCELKTELQ